ncbi:MAG TPA: RsmG family class I SAM-dependent methyltransferase [Acidimicrobiales bacterium]|nr:RsmG family class I SAM-dependent methyltransferase [Acidimicrobiales bacterium]
MRGTDAGGHSPTVLHEILADARGLGFLGPGPLDLQVRHAEGFVGIARRLSPGVPARLVDLGSGGGIPGLVLAAEWPEATVVLLEANGRRTAFLRRAVERLGLDDRVSVLEERAEVAGRVEGLRAGFDGVMARSFGRPAVLAECAAPLLKVGGWLLVSEPPRSEVQDDQDGRWPVEPLVQLGMEPAEVLHEEFEYRTLTQAAPCPERFPRRNGVPAKKPLF